MVCCYVVVVDGLGGNRGVVSSIWEFFYWLIKY